MSKLSFDVRFPNPFRGILTNVSKPFLTLPQRLLHLPALSDIPGDPHQPRGLALGAPQESGLDLGPDSVAILAAMLYLQGDGRGQRGFFPEFDFLESGDVFLGHLEGSRGQDLVQSQGEEFLRREPGQQLDCGAGKGYLLVQVHPPDEIPGILGQEAVLGFALPEGSPPFGGAG